MKTVASLGTLLVTVCSGLAAWYATDGLQAFTTDAARRLSIEQSPRQVPDVSWRAPFVPSPQVGEPGPVRIVDFIYTRCVDVCQTLGGAFGQMQTELAAELSSDKVQLLSVTFDLAQDSPERIRAWLARHSAGPGWTAAVPASEAELSRLRDVFGVTVRPDGMGGYVHNAGISIVDKQGKLTGVYDVDQWQTAAARARELASERVEHVGRN